MRLAALVFYIAAFTSCRDVYETVKPTSTPHVMEITRWRTITNARTCYKKQTIVQKDTLKRQVLSREIIEYNCRGAYTHQVGRTKWELQGTKLVKVK